MEIPSELAAVLEEELASVSPRRLALLVDELSKRYRGETDSIGGRYLTSMDDVAAYAAYRFPATYAAVYSALRMVMESLPGWNPRTMLDVGAGPGTASFAAVEAGLAVGSAVFLERDEHMISLGKRLASRSKADALRSAKWIKTDAVGSGIYETCDLAVISYVLVEIPEKDRSDVTAKVWNVSLGLLVVVEPGTPAGFRRIQEVRANLTAQGARVIAPCPHSGQCPMTDGNWCHFSARVARSRLHRLVKGGYLPYEDEKFAFVALSRPEAVLRIPGREGKDQSSGRVIRHPQVRPGHIRLEVCTPRGLRSVVVTRRQKELFRKARDMKWGSLYQTMPE